MAPGGSSEMILFPALSLMVLDRASMRGWRAGSARPASVDIGVVITAQSAQTSEKVLGELTPPVWVRAVQDAVVVVPSATGVPLESLGKPPLR
jgi:hypothetical protein